MANKKPYSDKTISGDKLYDLYKFVEAQRNVILKSIEDDGIDGMLEITRKSTLSITANALCAVMDEIQTILDKQ